MLASVSGPTNPTLTAIVESNGHGHALTIDGGWRESPAPPWLSSNAASRWEGASILSEERLVAREGARYWWLFLVSGILWLLIAWMVLRLDATSIATVGVLVGVVFLVAGVNEVGMAALAPGGWKVWHYLIAGVFLVGGLWGSSGRSTASLRWRRCWG